MVRYIKAFPVILNILLLFTLLPEPAASERPFEIKTGSKIVAFGDVHGAYNELITLLKETGIIDENLDWSGGDTHLVSLGDLFDRGPRSRDVIELLMKLQKQAPGSGGEVHVILGNHEIMVMTGDYRYTSRSDYDAFRGDESAGEHEALKKIYIHENDHAGDNNLSDRFEKFYPPGFIARDKALAPSGYIGKWLLNQHIILKINDTVFVHGGISSETADRSLKDINIDGKAELRAYADAVENLKKSGNLPEFVGYDVRLAYFNTKVKKLLEADPDIDKNPEKRPAWFDDMIVLYNLQKAGIFSSNGPAWYRGTSICHSHIESFNTEKFLKNVNARRIVIGHTPTLTHRVMERMDGLVIQLDTGMFKEYYRGYPSALIIDGEDVYVHYAGKTEKVKPVKEHFSLSEKLSGMTDPELEEILLTGEITGRKTLGTGITRPEKITLKKGEKTINAIFKTRDTNPGIQKNRTYNWHRNQDADRYVYDAAAYRLDRLLDLQMVPVAVLRKIDGKEGVLQYWVENSINERDREKSGVEFTGYCKKNEQYRLRYVFDILIYNEDRNLTNILWTKDDFRLVFIDHSRAFRISDSRMKQYRKAPLYISDYFRKKLESLNIENLTERLSSYLHPQQISAILKRRDLILRQGINTD